MSRSAKVLSALAVGALLATLGATPAHADSRTGVISCSTNVRTVSNTSNTWGAGFYVRHEIGISTPVFWQLPGSHNNLWSTKNGRWYVVSNGVINSGSSNCSGIV